LAERVEGEVAAGGKEQRLHGVHAEPTPTLANRSALPLERGHHCDMYRNAGDGL